MNKTVFKKLLSGKLEEEQCGKKVCLNCICKWIKDKKEPYNKAWIKGLCPHTRELFLRYPLLFYILEL